MKSRKGFTLIELLVVIAIIAILAAILFPVFIEAKNRAQMTKCLSNLKQLSFAWNAYLSDNDGGCPYIWPIDGAPGFNFVPGRKCWAGMVPDPNGGKYFVDPRASSLYPYIKNTQIFLCPMDKGRYATGWPCAEASKKKIALSYSQNGYFNVTKVYSRLGSKRASQMLLFIHESHDTINDGLYAFGTGVDRPTVVHYEGTTLSYVDGHAAYRKTTQLESEKNSGAWIPCN